MHCLEHRYKEDIEWYDLAFLVPQEMDNNIDNVIDDNAIREWTGQLTPFFGLGELVAAKSK